MKTAHIWDRHYGTDRSRQRYPDENLVRLLSRLSADSLHGPALDYGFGSGRHLSLLLESGFHPVSGIEVSQVALEAVRPVFPALDLRLADSGPRASLPWPDHSFAVIVCWGVMHYLPDDAMNQLLREFRRILRPGGALLGTLRSQRDTHFVHSEVADSSIRLFSEEEVGQLLGAYWSHFKIGHMERTPLGNTQLRISHWFFEAIQA